MAWVVLAVGFAVAAAAFGYGLAKQSDDASVDVGEAPEHEQTPQGVEEAARGWVEAWRTNTGTYDYLTPECQARWDRAAWNANVLEARAVATMFGLDFSGATVSAVTVQEFTPERAVAVVDISINGEPFASDDTDGNVWVYVDGGWRMTDCEATEGFTTATT